MINSKSISSASAKYWKTSSFRYSNGVFRNDKERDLSHEDLSSLDEHRRAGHITSLLEAFQVQRLHLLIATLHLHRMEGQHGDLVHVLGNEHGERFWG